MRNVFTILFISLFIFLCDSDPVSPLDECGVVNGDNSCFNEFIYPINIGNTWIYHGSQIHTNSNNDEIISSCILIDTVVVDLLDDEINNIYRFQTKSFSECDSGEEINISYNSTFHYFSNEDDGLYWYGGDGESSVIPWSSKLNQFLNLNINQQRDDEPRMSIKYPVELGEQWNSLNEVIVIDKLVSGMNSESFTIESLYPFIENINVYQEYSFNGLTTYQIELKITENPTDDPPISFNLYQNHHLVEYTIVE